MGLNSIFLKVYAGGKAITGEAETKGYEGQIEVDSFSWKLEPSAKEGSDTKKANASTKSGQLTLNKLFDDASGELMQAAKERKPMSSARFTLTSMELLGSGGKTLKLSELVLFDGFVESVDLKANESNKAISIKETVVLSFRKFKLMYYPPDRSTGLRKAAMTADYELANDGTTVSESE